MIDWANEVKTSVVCVNLTSVYILLLIGSIMITISIIASNFFLKIGVPTLLISLLLGIFISNTHLLELDFILPVYVLRLGEVALCIIIFAGGFEMNLKKIRRSFQEGIALSTIGVIVTTFVAGFLIIPILNLGVAYALLIAAIISSTDAAAVFSIFSQNQTGFKNDVDKTLQVESGSNDPIAYVMVIFLTSYITTSKLDITNLLISLLVNLVVAVITAAIMITLIQLLYKRIEMRVGQSPIILLTSIIILYSTNSLLGGSYFLSVFLFGLFLDMDALPTKTMNLNFFDSFAWLMESILFIILGYQLFLKPLRGLLVEGVLISIILIFIARPIGVLLSLLPFRRHNKSEYIFISSGGLKGASPIVFGLVPIVAGIDNSDIIFDITFIVVLISLVFQGITINKIAKLLGITHLTQVQLLDNNTSN